MSYTTLYLVPESGEIREFAEYRNAYGSAAYCWTSLCDRYLGGLQWILSADAVKRLWRLASDGRMPEHHKTALQATFDNVMVRRENLGKVAKAFEAFVEDFPPGQQACSLLKQAADLRRMYLDDPECFAVCWCQTSVAGGAWMASDDEVDQDGDPMWRMWDISKDEGHWFLFDEVEEEVEGNVAGAANDAGALTVREACKRRIPLDGSDAQALEHALTITERERDEARLERDRLIFGIRDSEQLANDRLAELKELKDDDGISNAFWSGHVSAIRNTVALAGMKSITDEETT